MQRKRIPTSSQIEQASEAARERQARGRQMVEEKRLAQSISAGFGSPRESRSLSIWLKKAVASVAAVIPEFSSLITLLKPIRNSISPTSLEAAIAGRQTDFGQRSESAGSFAQTATESIPPNSKDITPSPLSSMPSPPSAKHIISDPINMAALRDAIQDGTADLMQVSVADWLHMALLEFSHSGQQVNFEQRFLYKGNMYIIHAHVAGVVPAEQPRNLEKMV